MVEQFVCVCVSLLGYYEVKYGINSDYKWESIELDTAKRSG